MSEVVIPVDETKYGEEKAHYDATFETLKDRASSNLLSSTNTTGNEEPAALTRFGGVIKKQGKVSCSTWLDNDYCFVSLLDGNMAVHNAKNGGLRFYTPLMDQASAWVNHVEFNQFTSGNDSLVAVGGLDNKVTVMKIPVGDIVGDCLDPEKAMVTEAERTKSDKVFCKHGGGIYSIKWVTKEKLISGSGDKTCMLWDMTLGGGMVKEPVRTMKGDSDVNDVAYFNDNEILTANGDGFSRLFDLRVNTGTGVVATFAGHVQGLTKIRTIGDTRCFVTASEDATLRVWDARSMTSVQTCGGEPDAQAYSADKTEKLDNPRKFTAMCLTASNRHAYVGTMGGKIKGFDLLSGEQLSVKFSGKDVSGMEREGAKITSLTMSPDNYSFLATSDAEDKNVCIYAPSC